MALAVPAGCGRPAAFVASVEVLATNAAATQAWLAFWQRQPGVVAPESGVDRVLRKVLQFISAVDVRGLATMSLEEKAVVLQYFARHHMVSEDSVVLVRCAFGLQPADLARLPA